jgi:hypothetical protein
MESPKQPYNFFQTIKRPGRPQKWSVEMMRVVIDVVEANQPVTDFKEVAEEIGNRLAQLPAEKTNDLTEAQIIQKVQNFTKCLIPGAVPSDFPKMGKIVLDFDRLADGLLSAEEYQAWSGNRKSEPKSARHVTRTGVHPGGGERTMNTEAARSKQNNQVSSNNQTGGSDQYTAIRKHGQISAMQATIAPATIRRAMSAIYRQICRTVKDRLSETEIDPERPITDLLFK